MKLFEKFKVCLYEASVFAVTFISFVAVSEENDSPTVPSLFNFQGRVNNVAEIEPDSEVVVEVRMYNSLEEGDAIWGPQVFDGTSELGHGAKVNLAGGFFNLIIGSEDTNGRQLADVLNGQELFLELKVNELVLAPRQRILATPYAIRSEFSKSAAHAETADNATNAENATVAEGLKASTGVVYGWEAIFESGDPANGMVLSEPIEAMREIITESYLMELDAQEWPISNETVFDSYNIRLERLSKLVGTESWNGERFRKYKFHYEIPYAARQMEAELLAHAWPIFNEDDFNTYQADLLAFSEMAEIAPWWSNLEFEELRSRSIAEFEGVGNVDFSVDLGPVENPTLIQVEMLIVSGGTFNMGSLPTEEDRDAREGPVKTVTLSDRFWMSKYEITQAQWETVTGEVFAERVSGKELAGLGPNYPAYHVSWDDAMNFCQLLSARERETGRLTNEFEFRLPTEAEWEYVCRAGTTTRFYYGDDSEYTQLVNYAWVPDNASISAEPIGLKQANDWAFHDMSGNVREWCFDYYRNQHAQGLATDYMGPETADSGTGKVTKGGSWRLPRTRARSASRSYYSQDTGVIDLGFRIVLQKTIVN